MQDLDMNNNRSLVVFYSYFRVILAIILLIISYIDNGVNIPGDFSSKHFAAVCLLYLLLSFYQSVSGFRSGFEVGANFLLFAIGYDILTTLVLIHISGGLATGFAILLITPICIAAIFFQGRMATAFAAVASLGILADSIFYDVVIKDSQGHIVPAGLFGIVFFAASLCVQFLSNSIRKAQVQANTFEQQAHKMAELNQLIVQRIRTGVVIYNNRQEPILFNQAAESLLDPVYPAIKDCEPLNRNLKLWRSNPENNHNLINLREKGTDIKVNFSILDKDHVITFMEDMTEVSQQALQMKLASLGRLAASIAHEIRNPLNAISHSVQLLDESPQFDSDDKYLLNIAQNHCKRINEIISNIQSMSQRRGYKPEQLELNAFCQQLKDDYEAASQDTTFIIRSEDEDILAPFDPTQLRQILSNLIDNAIRYSRKATESGWVTLSIERDTADDVALIRVYDLGQGVPANNREKLFEPFFTSETTGTGLGLYISRELCTLNQSQLTYSHNNNKHYFQIRFAHAQRDIVVKNKTEAMESLDAG